MADSIFTRVFSYRQRDNLSPLENFLTEIFAFAIENDRSFRIDFFSKLLSVKLNEKNLSVSTQAYYDKLGRPDIELSNDKTAFLFECKIESNERRNQLNDYATILTTRNTKFKDLHIVFLTKYFDHKEIKDTRVNLHLIRWFQVYELINETHNEIAQQLKSFLKEQNMEKVKNFTMQDLLAMKTIPATMSKMDELLEYFKPVFQKKYGSYSKESSRSTRLPNSCYINYVTLKYKQMEYWLLIGFDWDYDSEIPYLALTVEFHEKRFAGTDLLNILKRELVAKKKWELIDYDGVIHISALKPVTDFISLQEDNIVTMRKFIEANLKILDEIRVKYPKLLRK